MLGSLEPELQPGEYVFAAAPKGGVPPDVDPVVTVREREGLTLVVPLEQAERAGLDFEVAMACITLRVHSSLEAVGLTATCSGQLAAAAIACNVVAGLHHDHIFVPADKGEAAQRVLGAMQRRRRPDFDAQLAEELAAMRAEDQRVRNPRVDPARFGVPMTTEEAMEVARIDVANTDRLREIVREHGWPGCSLVGTDGAQAAWLLAQHADRQLDFQREALTLLSAAVAAGEAKAEQVAYLTDRIRVGEGRPQVYGTQMTADQHGAPVAWPIEDEEHVEERRRAMGMPSIAEHLQAWMTDPGED